MKLFAIVLNGILFAYSLYLIYGANFPGQPKFILLQFLLLITPSLSLFSLLFNPQKKDEKWML